MLSAQSYPAGTCLQWLYSSLETDNSISYFWVPHIILSQHSDNLREVLDETLLFLVINTQFLVSIHSEGGVKYSVAGCGFFYLFTFRQRGGQGEREREKYQCVVASRMSPTGDLAHNPGMCPDWELNQWPFGSQVVAQSIEWCQPGLFLFLFFLTLYVPSPTHYFSMQFIFFKRLGYLLKVFPRLWILMIALSLWYFICSLKGFFYFLSIFYSLCYYSCPNFSSPLFPFSPAPPLPSTFSPTLVHVHGLYI